MSNLNIKLNFVFDFSRNRSYLGHKGDPERMLFPVRFRARRAENGHGATSPARDARCKGPPHRRGRGANMKKVLIILAVLILGAAGWYYENAHRADEAQGDLVLYGNVDIRQVSLAFEQGGRITALFAEEGDRVKEGALLAEVDVTSLVLQAQKLRADIAAQEQNVLKMERGNRPEEIARAEAALRTAEASLEQARRNDARIAALRRSNSVSTQERENAQTALRVAQGQRDEAHHALALLREGFREEDIAMAREQLNAAKASLALMEHNISLGRLLAPSDAQVTSRLLEKGDMASSATPVFLLSLTTPKWVRAYVTEPQLGRVRSGMKADIRTDSFPETVPGHVGYISPTAEFTPKSVQTEDLRTSLLYEVRIIADDEKDILRLGMPVTVLLHEEGGHGN